MNCKWIYIERVNQRIRSNEYLLYKHSLWIGYLFFKWNFAMNCSNHRLRTPSGIFGQFISTYFGTVSPLSIFSINQPSFLQKKLSLYILIPNIYLGWGFEFGLQRFMGFNHCVSVVRGKGSFFSETAMRFLNLQRNIPNHYPSLEIWMSCLLLWAGNSNSKFRIVICNIIFGDWTNNSHFLKKSYL